MKKRIAILPVLLCAACLMIGCSKDPGSAQPPDSSQLSQQLRQEIEENWYEFRSEELVWDDKIPPTYGARYYGTYNGYTILFDNSGMQLQAYWAIQVGTESFKHYAGFQLYAYKDGEFIWLPDAYEQGLISDDAVSQAAKIHRAFEWEDWEATARKYHEMYPDEPTWGPPSWATEPTE